MRVIGLHLVAWHGIEDFGHDAGRHHVAGSQIVARARSSLASQVSAFFRAAERIGPDAGIFLDPRSPSRRLRFRIVLAGERLHRLAQHQRMVEAAIGDIPFDGCRRSPWAVAD